MRALNKDIRVDQGLLEHHKFKQLKRAVGVGACEYLIALWTWTAANRFKGVLHGMTPAAIEAVAAWDGADGVLFGHLQRLGLIDVAADGTVSVHDWETHQSYVCNSDTRQVAARNAATKRWQQDTDAVCPEHAQSMPPACGENAAGMRNVCGEHAPTPAPAPPPVPAPPPKPETQEQDQDPPPPSAEPAGGPSSSSQQDKPRRRRQADTATAAERDDLAAIRAEWDCLIREKSLTWRWKGADGEVLRYLRRNGGASKLIDAISHLRIHPIREDKRAFEWTMLYIARAQDSQRNAIDRPAEILEGAWDDTEEEQRAKIEKLIAMRRQQQAVADAHH